MYFLVNSGASNNFMDLNFCGEIFDDECEEGKIRLANGDLIKLYGSQTCSLKLGSYSASSPFKIIDLKGRYDAILGRT